MPVASGDEVLRCAQDDNYERAGGPRSLYSGHNHAAPRTPLESPCLGGSRRVVM